MTISKFFKPSCPSTLQVSISFSMRHPSIESLSIPDRSLQSLSSTTPLCVNINPYKIPEGGKTRTSVRITAVPSKTWHCTRHLQPRLRRIESRSSIRRWEDFKVAEQVAWKVTNSNEGSMNSQTTPEALSPTSEGHRAPTFPRPWITGQHPVRTYPRDLDSRNYWRHELQQRRQ